MTKSRRPPKSNAPKASAQHQPTVEKPRVRQTPVAGASPAPDVVDEASDESFPASDPPAWTDTAVSKNNANH